MTTKPPSAVQSAPADSLEQIAYASVQGLPTREAHDLDRLGYNIWLWLTYRRDPLELAVRAAGVRFLIPEEEAIERIAGQLKARGVQL